MRKLIFKMAQKMYFTPLKIAGKVVFKHLLPWALWSPIYDRYHRL